VISFAGLARGAKAGQSDIDPTDAAIALLINATDKAKIDFEETIVIFL
jgi:hypothetical protein